jgi:hypothetical protein
VILILIGLILVYSIPVYLLRKSGGAVILVAVAVMVATGFVGFNLVIAAGWSALHGALSEGAFNVLIVVAAVAPPALGFFTGVLTRHRLRKTVAPSAIGPS